jgi:hypothetical protein
MLLTRADIKSIIKQHSPIFLTIAMADTIAGAIVDAETTKLLAGSAKGGKKERKEKYPIRFDV